MKLLLTLLFISMLFASCQKENCVTCIAESSSGIIQRNETICSSRSGYTDGYEAGFKEYAIDSGFTYSCSYFYK